MNIRITYDGLNWWISVSADIECNINDHSNDGIGIDLGIKDLAICSGRNIYKSINKTQTIKKLEKKKRRLQRSTSRKYEKNKLKGKYCKTSNIIKGEKNF
jgi:putative transposase